MKEYVSPGLQTLILTLALMACLTVLAIRGVEIQSVVALFGAVVGGIFGVASPLGQQRRASDYEPPAAPKIPPIVTGILGGVLAVAISIACTGCGPRDPCTPADTRCAGHFAQVCQSDGRWAHAMDCDQVALQSGGEWLCAEIRVEEPGGEVTSGHTCMPKLEPQDVGAE